MISRTYAVSLSGLDKRRRRRRGRRQRRAREFARYPG